jgi:hypothetical protein
VVFAQLPALRERLRAVERRLGLVPGRSVTEGAAPEGDAPGDAGTPVP